MAADKLTLAQSKAQARVLGFSIGLWPAVGAVACAFVGLLMAAIFQREEGERVTAQPAVLQPEAPKRPLWKSSIFFACLVALLVVSDWYNPGGVVVGHVSGEQFAAVALQERRDVWGFN